MEQCAIVVALHAELNEVPACLGRFLGPELDIDVAHGRFKEDLDVLVEQLVSINLGLDTREKDPTTEKLYTYGLSYLARCRGLLDVDVAHLEELMENLAVGGLILL